MDQSMKARGDHWSRRRRRGNTFDYLDLVWLSWERNLDVDVVVMDP